MKHRKCETTEQRTHDFDPLQLLAGHVLYQAKRDTQSTNPCTAAQARYWLHSPDATVIADALGTTIEYIRDRL